MKQIYMLISGLLLSSFGMAQGLLISEVNNNPSGSDGAQEYVELLATEAIDFSTTPYTVIVANMGTATANGWVEGGSHTYAFEITSGTVSTGDVVYVGGTAMAPTGTIIRSIDVTTTAGDGGIGNSTSSGIFGNGGANADGVAVFNVGVGSITASTVPVDVILWGDGIGGAEVSAADGLELAVNDNYTGGKIISTSYLIADDELFIATGEYDTVANAFTINRTFAGGAATATSEIVLTGPSPELTLDTEDITVDEDAGTISFDVSIASSNTSPTEVDIVLVSGSTVTNTDDFVLLDTTIVFPASATGTQSFEVEIVDDMEEEQSEYIVLTMDNFVNGEVGGNDMTIIYITDNDREVLTATNELKLDLITSFSTGTEGLSAAEIVVYDEGTSQLYVSNSEMNNLDIIDITTPATPVIVESINFDSVGAINSVAVFDGLVAVALEAPVATDNGFITLLDSDGTWLNRLEVGVLPDMVTFNHAGDQLVIACEGEPDDDYTVDPEGSVSIINIDDLPENLTAANVIDLNFLDFDALEADLKDDGVRIFGPGASVSEDLEPEYVTILPGDETAVITLQENNAIAVVDLVDEEITDILPLGFKDHMLFGNGLDASNQTSGINIANIPTLGMYQPDAISNIEIQGEVYLITANEGDARDYDGYSEEERVKDLVLDPTAYPNADYIQNSLWVGRMKTTTATGDTDEDGDIDQIYTYGARSFTIWDTDGEVVFDSGDMIEYIIANDPAFVDLFNMDNDPGEPQKNRSDDKGPEPEGVATAMIDGNAYLFVSLERVGGVMAFNINDVEEPIYIGYYNNRTLPSDGPDRGAEGMIYIDAASSPTTDALLILANEVSSTLTIYSVEACSELSGINVGSVSGDVEFCEGDSLQIQITSTGTISQNWMLDGDEIDGATDMMYYAQDGGVYNAWYENATEGCSGVSDSLMITEFPAPVPVITVASAVLSTGTFASYQWYFEGAAISGATSDSHTPDADGEYTVVVTSDDGCEGEASYTVNFTSIAGLENNKFSVYPNPASGTVFVSAQAPGEAIVRIYNIAGEIVYSETMWASKSNPASIDTEEFTSGLYIIEITQNNNAQSQKLIIK